MSEVPNPEEILENEEIIGLPPEKKAEIKKNLLKEFDKLHGNTPEEESDNQIPESKD
jgi:hypothetical protein